MPFTIAIDGPSGAGKSSIADAIAAHYGIGHLDTGAMYRCIGLKALRRGVDPKDREAVEALLRETRVDVEFDGARQIDRLDGEAVDDLIRTPDVSSAASAVSGHPAVREALVAMQRELALRFDLVLDGRDIGTVVLPDAPCKIYLTASPECRILRRAIQLRERGREVDAAVLDREIRERDAADSTRDCSPLRPADDAVEVDSSALDFDGTVAKVIAICEAARKRHEAGGRVD